jgi:putative ABC transport system permease protein
MEEMPRWRRYLRLWGPDPRADVEDELTFHIEERARLNVARGLSPERALEEAEQRFGDISRIRTECIEEGEYATRRASTGERLGDIARDVRMGVRSLARAPVYTLTAAAALALGIGANTAVFTVLSAVLLRPLPYADADRVVVVHNAWEGAAEARLSPAEYIDYAERVRAFSALGVYGMSNVNLVEDDRAERVSVAFATASTFAALGVAPEVGRIFTDGGGDAESVLLSHEYWQSRFGGADDLIGRGVVVNGVTHTVLGILPQDVRLPVSYGDAQPPAMFLPLSIDQASEPVRGSHFLFAVARLAQGWSVETADAELKRVAREMTALHAGDYPEAMRFAAFVRPVHADVVGDARPLLLVLAAAVALVLLIACANVSSLVLTRTEDRRRELAVRSALGASRWRITRQLLIEHLLLALVAGAAGLLLAMLGVRALALLQPGDIPRLADARIDSRVLMFTLMSSLLATILVALAPLRFGIGALGALREGGTRTTATRASNRVRRALITAEVALSIVLLAGAGLLMRSFANLVTVDTGYRTEQVLTVPVSLPASSYPDDASRRLFFSQLVSDASRIPGVLAAGAVVNLPLATTVGDLDIQLEGRPVADSDVSPRLDWQIVTPGWFDAMGVEIVRGRAITTVDDARATGAVVLSEAAARKYWSDADPIGQRFLLGANAGPGWVTVVGIARDVRHGTLTDAPPPIMYLPHAQFTFWHGGSAAASMTLVLHTAGAPLPTLEPLRELVRRMDAHVPLGHARTMEQVVSTAIAEPRFATSVLITFALLAMALAAIGIYGLVGYTVARRTREIAIRMALGAESRALVRQIVLHAMQPVLIGIVIGAVAALVVTRAMRSMLYGVTPHDPATFALIVALLSATALVACLVPARRAAAVAPLSALREE